MKNTEIFKKNSAFVQKEIENFGNNKNESDMHDEEINNLLQYINFNQIMSPMKIIVRCL